MYTNSYKQGYVCIIIKHSGLMNKPIMLRNNLHGNNNTSLTDLFKTENDSPNAGISPNSNRV